MKLEIKTRCYPIGAVVPSAIMACAIYPDNAETREIRQQSALTMGARR